jgi:hypothetical protein
VSVVNCDNKDFIVFIKAFSFDINALFSQFSRSWSVLFRINKAL